jgi:hypothetical protein
MKVLAAILLLALVGCSTDGGPESKSPPRVMPARDPAVCRIKSPQTAGSLIPLGGNVGLTARHVYRQPVAWIDGKLSGLDELRRGECAEVGQGDWVMVRVNDTDLPVPDEVHLGYEFDAGSKVYICGFPSATASHSTGEPTLVSAIVTDTPPWVPKDVRSDEVIFLDIDGNPDLSGMSGGPVVVPDASDTGWRVVGMYLGEWHSGVWSRYVFRRLPKDVLEVRPKAPLEPR